jgi:outer membrane protein, heavy metal efflux system
MKPFRSKLLLGLALFSAIPASRASEANAAGNHILITPELIDGLLAEAVSQNPAFAAARARADSASAAVDAVRTWADPVATVGLSVPAARGFKSSEEGNLLYGVEQKIPVFNRPQLAREIAAADADREKLVLGDETAQLRRSLTTAMIALALADTTIDFAQQDLGWLDATLTSVDQRIQVGKASQVEWLKIQTERAKAADQIKTLRLEREHRQVQLNRILNRELHTPWLPLEIPASPNPPMAEEDLVVAAIEAEPKLAVLRQEIAEAEANSRLTHAQRRPEVGVGVQGRSYTGDAGFREGMLTVNFSLPWLNARHYASDERRDQAKVRVSEHEFANYTLGLREEIHHFAIDLDPAHRQATLYRDELIPLTEQTLSSASTAWANNLGPFQDLLDARRMLVEHRLMLSQALANQARIRAELSLLTGRRDLIELPPTRPPIEPVKTMSGASK